MLGFLQAFNDIFIRIAQPLLLGQLLMYFRLDPVKTKEEAIYYGVGLIVLNAVSAITINQYILHSFQNGMKVRIAVCSTVYRKALRLSKTALGETSPGKVVNLLSNDVNRFDIVSVFLHSMWSAPLLTIIVGFLLWREAGLGGLIGMGVIFVVTPLQAYTGKLSSKFRLQTALRTDERVRLMDEIISGIQVIKLYAWEIPFAKLTTLARKMELKIVRKNSYVRALYMTFMLFTTRMALFCTMLAIIVLGGELTASKVFVTAAYYGVITQTMSQMFVRGVAEIAEALVSLRRIRTFLEYDEKETERIDPCNNKYTNGYENGGVMKELPTIVELPPKVSMSLKNLTAKWDSVKGAQVGKKKKKRSPTIVELTDDTGAPTLDDINIDFKKGKLIGVIGPVGAGKSSLLQAILRELPLKSGSVLYNGKVSYAAQEAWVFAGSVRQNILFGQEMDNERYEATVKACALLKDFEQFPYGDRTIIGERGASLSGGQKARISLARAVYRRADIYLLDDPLSAVDAHVGRHLFDLCIGTRGKLGKQRATRILVTHQVHYLKDADYVVIMKEGKIVQQGSPQELSRSGIDIAQLLESEEFKDASSEYDGGSSKYTGRRSRSSSISSVRSEQFMSVDESGLDDDDVEEKIKKETSEPKENVEESSKGKIKGWLFGHYIKAGAGPCLIFFVFALFLFTQVIASFIDWWVSYWTKQEELRNFIEKVAPEGDMVNRLFNDTEIFNASAVNDTFSSFLPTNETLIAAVVDEADPLATNICAIVHGSLLGALFLFAITRSITFFQSAVKSSQKLHDAMFKGVVSVSVENESLLYEEHNFEWLLFFCFLRLPCDSLT